MIGIKPDLYIGIPASYNCRHEHNYIMSQWILFKKPLFERICDGTKTSTLRLRSSLRSGETAQLRCGRECRHARIVSIEDRTIQDIDEDVIRNKGLRDRQELIQILNECYPGKSIDNLKYIQFELL